MNIINSVILNLMLTAGTVVADEASAVSLQHGGCTLEGTLLQPAAARSLAILHAGSGPTDRDGNQPGLVNDALKLLAAGLYDRGIASLRYDKRGSGGSRCPDLQEERLEPAVFADDLAAWVAWARDRTALSRIYLVGHSEGALFSKMVADRAGVAGVVSLAGAGRNMGALLREQTEGRRPGEIGEQFEFILSELEAGRTVDAVPPVLMVLFRPSVQPYLIAWAQLEPAALAAEMAVPLLVVGGDADLQVGRTDFDALVAARPDAGQAWIAGMNHVLKGASGDIAAQMASYTAPDHPLHPELIPALVTFINNQEE